MKNNSQNYLTNSRVGRRWPIETPNDIEHDVENTSMMPAKESSQQDSDY